MLHHLPGATTYPNGTAALTIVNGHTDSALGYAAGSHVRSALFVDFDNMYWGLRRLDPAAAARFADRPERWLEWLEQATPAQPEANQPASRRAVLLRKCYLNPGAYDRDRGSFSRYRQNFVRAGFQVVDCPSLTTGAKNGADIQMVMDVLDLIEHRTRFDEFILLSGDADFTPVLHRLRVHDRRTVILPVGFSASAYRVAADTVVTSQGLIEQGLFDASDASDARGNHQATTPPLTLVEGPGSPPSSADGQTLRSEALEVIRKLVADACGPVPSGLVALKLNETLGARLRESEWGGTRGFKDFVQDLVRDVEAPRFEVSWSAPGYFYDPLRHGLPGPSPTPASGFAHASP